MLPPPGRMAVKATGRAGRVARTIRAAPAKFQIAASLRAPRSRPCAVVRRGAPAAERPCRSQRQSDRSRSRGWLSDGTRRGQLRGSSQPRCSAPHPLGDAGDRMRTVRSQLREPACGQARRSKFGAALRRNAARAKQRSARGRPFPPPRWFGDEAAHGKEGSSVSRTASAGRRRSSARRSAEERPAIDATDGALVSAFRARLCVRLSPVMASENPAINRSENASAKLNEGIRSGTTRKTEPQPQSMPLSPSAATHWGN